MPLNYKSNTRDNTLVSVPQKGRENSVPQYTAENPKYQLSDIIFAEDVLADLKNVIAFDKYKELLMSEWGMRKVYPERRGLLINLYGESGTGKTMAAHAIACELGKKIIVVNYAEIESKYVGETSKNLVQLFQTAEEQQAVLLFDEADALLSKRVTNMTTSNDVSVNQTKSVLLNILNDFCGIAIFTTNFISNFDFAFMRRIPFQIRFDLPGREQRKRIWEHYLLCGVPQQCDVDFIARKYEGISGSDIANCVWLAALKTLSDKKDIVDQECVCQTIEKIIQSKKDHAMSTDNGDIKVTVRDVDEEYALKQQKGQKI